MLLVKIHEEGTNISIYEIDYFISNTRHVTFTEQKLSFNLDKLFCIIETSFNVYRCQDKGLEQGFPKVFVSCLT